MGVGIPLRYKESSKFKKMGYEEDFLRFLENAIGEVDRKIKRGHARLAVNDSQNNIKIQQVTKENEEKIIVLQKQIDELLVKSEGLAEEGNVEEAQDTIKEVEKLNFERDKFKIEIDNAKAMERHMRVCEICGAFLIINDAPSRVDDHNSGKQHTGFVKVREAALRMREQLFGKDSKPRGIDDNIQNGNTGPSPVLVNDIKENETVKKRSRSKSKHESERHKSHKSSHKKSSSKSSHSSSRKERPHGSSRDEKREHGRHGHTQGESRRR
ncbi:luc7-like protein 3 isoform X2 [Gordionus sp. m RMFG-2023]|uniref:luc7-like protein 3 isoform X2 n=1 Tax=Gordionus sp. m RMFG-2023 TaxID=3053472 RepID=UPI0031FC3A05